jgi:hypothetical protein
MVRDALGYAGYDSEELEKLRKLVADMRTPLYLDCKGKWTKLFASLKLLQLKATHHMTNRGFKSMLDLIKDMLPEGNQIPMTTYEVKQNVCPFRLEVERIHACKNDCVMFRGDDYEALTECPECGFPQYKRRFDGGDDKRKHGAPYKVAWYFPIYQRMRRLFATRKDAELLR